jgi:hypothetical protein
LSLADVAFLLPKLRKQKCFTPYNNFRSMLLSLSFATLCLPKFRKREIFAKLHKDLQDERSVARMLHSYSTALAQKHFTFFENVETNFVLGSPNELHMFLRLNLAHQFEYSAANPLQSIVSTNDHSNQQFAMWHLRQSLG